VDYLFTLELPRSGAGRSCLSLRALKLSGSLCTFRGCTCGLAQGSRRNQPRYGFPEFIPSTSRITPRRHRFDESPALTN
jgi:hypothetical protein